VTALAAERVPQTIAAALIARAQAVCERAADLPMAQEIGEVTGALAELAGALRFYRDIASGRVAPEEAWEHLHEARGGLEWRLAIALRLAAEEATEEAREVIKVIAEQVGDGIAAEVRGEERGTR